MFGNVALFVVSCIISMLYSFTYHPLTICAKIKIRILRIFVRNMTIWCSIFNVPSQRWRMMSFSQSRWRNVYSIGAVMILFSILIVYEHINLLSSYTNEFKVWHSFTRLFTLWQLSVIFYDIWIFIPDIKFEK